MSHTHTPRSEFIERLESQIGAEVRRRNRMPDAPRWWMLSPLKMAFAAGVLAVTSMAIGGAVVSAAYQAQSNERRDVLAAGYMQRVQLAQKKLDLANVELKDAQQRVQI